MTAAAVDDRMDESLRATLVALRRDIHQHPELSSAEHETSNRLEAALGVVGVTDVRRVADTGLVARVAGRSRSAPVVALRGDIDALPIHEATRLPYASVVPGVMHACGHDVHATWAVGAAALLLAEPADGDVLVVLQPAEETGSGAARILETGALDGVRAIFGGHVDRRFEVGEVVAEEGPLAASTDTFVIELSGSGAHAARPHEARDPIVAAAAIVSALQTIVARRLNPAMAGVVTIGSIHSGTAANVIPSTATLAGTVRAIEPASREMMVREVRQLVESVAAGFGIETLLTFEAGTPPIINPPETTGWARAAAARVVGADRVKPLGFLNLGGEDFAHYMERMPGCFLRIGAREPGGQVIPAHSASFHAAEGSIFVGAAVLAQCARVASAALASRS